MTSFAVDALLTKGVTKNALETPVKAPANSVEDFTKLPYLNCRTSCGPDQVMTVWNKHQKNDKFVDIMSRPIEWEGGTRKGVWHMGHRPGYEYRHLKRDYTEGRITKDEFWNIIETRIIIGLNIPGQVLLEHMNRMFRYTI